METKWKQMETGLLPHLSLGISWCFAKALPIWDPYDAIQGQLWQHALVAVTPSEQRHGIWEDLTVGAEKDPFPAPSRRTIKNNIDEHWVVHWFHVVPIVLPLLHPWSATTRWCARIGSAHSWLAAIVSRHPEAIEVSNQSCAFLHGASCPSVNQANAICGTHGTTSNPNVSPVEQHPIWNRMSRGVDKATANTKVCCTLP